MKDFKPILFFLARFLGTYIILSILYKLYLDQYIPHNIPDPFTKLTADWASKGLNSCGFLSFSNIADHQPWMRLVVDGRVASIVNEGCNAISILIIFVAFIVAFYTNFKQTFTYIIVGLITLIIMNVARIMLLNYIFRYHEEYGKMAHDYLFPAIIYGSIVILWIVWIKFFVSKFKKNETK